MSSENKTHQSKSGFARYMSETFVPKYSNNVMGLVYVGAAILILIVGLRGLGSIASRLPIVPAFALDGATGKIHPNLVMFALVLEFCILILLAVVTYFTPVEQQHAQPGESKDGKFLNHEEIAHEIDHIQKMTTQEIRIIEEYIEKFEQHIESKITGMHKHNKQILTGIKDNLKQ